MENKEEQAIEQTIELNATNSRLENQPNVLLERIKVQVFEQMKARTGKETEQDRK